MTKAYNNTIFDVGANNGLDGLILAILNPDMFIYAFEPNKEINKISILNKLKLENEFDIKIKNHKIVEKGVSNINGYADFFIGEHSGISSLLNYKEIDISLKKKINHKKKIKIQLIKLSQFIKDENIKNICYLHIDVEGADLNVIEGLEDKIKNVYSGVIEAAKDKELSLYKYSHSLDNVKEVFKKKNLEIKKIIEQDFRNVNIYFKNKDFEKNNFFLHPRTSYNTRYFNRILENRKKIKDRCYKFFIKYWIR
jgi:FkbM family methyltransferase